jgi:hypothetical protein
MCAADRVMSAEEALPKWKQDLLAKKKKEEDERNVCRGAVMLLLIMHV